MVKNKNIEKSKLYENMVKVEKEAYDAQDLLLNTIEKWFSGLVSDDTRIVLAHGGTIQIRTVEKIEDKIIEDFSKDFGFYLSWFKDEYMTDYRNQDPVSVRIYEYSFIPVNIKEILGDNQVSLKE